MKLSDWKRLIAPVQRKIFLSLSRAILKAVNNSKKTQKIQIVALSDETITDIERFQEYGFETYPIIDAEAFAAFLNGNRDHGIILCVHDRRYRPTNLAEGEIANYTDEDQSAGGHRIHFKRGQIIEINCKQAIVNAVDKAEVNTKECLVNATVKAKITSPDTEITGGTVKLASQAVMQKLLNDNFANLYDGHTHPESGGGTTGGPNQLAGAGHRTTNTEGS